MIWHALNVALVALGYPSGIAEKNVIPDAVRTSKQQTDGHVRTASATGEDTPDTLLPTSPDTVHAPYPDAAGLLRFPFCFRPAAIRVTVLGTGDSPTNALVVHIPEVDDPSNAAHTDPWSARGWIDTPAHDATASARPTPPLDGHGTVNLDIAVPAADGISLLSMCRVTGTSYPPRMRMVSVELWAPTGMPTKWLHAKFDRLSGPADPEIDGEVMRVRCRARVSPSHAWALLMAQDTIPPADALSGAARTAPDSSTDRQ
jgi:hypothetical protein